MTEVLITAARPLDAGPVGGILGGSNAQMSWLPPLHSGAEDIDFAGQMIDAGWVRVAKKKDQVIGFIARDEAEIHALYVLPEAQGQLVGTALLRDAMKACNQLSLWTYEANDGASRFYRRHGFEEVRRTDGAGNEAGLPDIRYAWKKEKS